MTLQRSKGFVTLLLIQSVDCFMPIHVWRLIRLSHLRMLALWFDLSNYFRIIPFFYLSCRVIGCYCLWVPRDWLFLASCWFLSHSRWCSSEFALLAFQADVICVYWFENFWISGLAPLESTLHGNSIGPTYYVTREQTRVPPLGTIVFKAFLVTRHNRRFGFTVFSALRFLICRQMVPSLVILFFF